MTPATSPSCDAVRDELATWALEGGAEPSREVAAHCATCEDCAEIRDEYVAVVGMLPFALPLETRSSAVRETLAARVATPPAARRPIWLFPAAIAAAIVIAVVAGGGGYWLGRDSGDSGVKTLVPERAERFQLQRSDAAGANSGGVLLVDRESDSALLNAWGLPQLGEDEIYQFWFMRRDGTRISAFTFRPDSDGRSVRVAGLPEDFDSIGGVWVTKEPGTGSVTPKGPNVLITRWP